MLILLFFAFISGLFTIFAPCIWPILPVIFAASATGGKQKPLGITLGVTLSFAIITIFLASFISIIPINPNLIRLLAVLVIGILGFAYLVPKFSTMIETSLSTLSGKYKFNQNPPAHGFTSGFLTGLSLGIVWSPCAGPILATIATLAATQKVSLNLILVTSVYVAGIGIPLFLFATIGQNLFRKLKNISQYTGKIHQVFGIIMILTAILIATNYDTFIEAKLLNYFTSYSRLLTKLESNPQVTQKLSDLKNQTPPANLLDNFGLLNASYKAPGFTGLSLWLNSNPITLADLKGKVVLVDFWDYTCINCLRTLPHVAQWYQKYHANGFEVIGIHTPEFLFEHDINNVRQAISMYGITYPVALDNNYDTWNAFNNQYWPAEYLIDVNGFVRRTEFGEGQYDQMEKAIQTLLNQAGNKVNQPLAHMPDQTPTMQISPETYLGAKRMEYFYPTGSVATGETNFSLPHTLPVNNFGFGGTWTIKDDYAMTGKNAALIYNFSATKVYAIFRPPSNGEGHVQVFLDGKTIDAKNSGSDVQNGSVIVNSDRLYNLINLPGKLENHLLELKLLDIGISVYTFTFG
jgi:cytochrome c biogenesis protein CcdA/thiol-disulfide isomerase/thioredoxin